MRKTPAGNTLFYGDNLAILRDHVEDESVDLIYLDPPFNSNATYNVLFKAPGGEARRAQIEAFGDGGVNGVLNIKSDGKRAKKAIVMAEDLFKPSDPLHLPWQDTSVFEQAERESENHQTKMDL